MLRDLAGRECKLDDEARVVGLFLAELAVDHFVPPPAHYLTPMNIGWAVDILRRAADGSLLLCTHRPKLNEALDFLEKSVEPAWLVRRYRFTKLILFPFVAPVP